MNVLRGTCQVTLGEQPAELRFNNNAFFLACKRMKKSFGEFMQGLSEKADPMVMLEHFSELIAAAYINAKQYKGEKVDVSDETLMAWINDMSEEDMASVMGVINGASSLTKAEPAAEGNA